MPTAHVIGAGLSGLSSAIRLADDGYQIQIYEAAGQAGGRCRSFHDASLDALIDNGNHLLLSGNTSTMSYLERIGTKSELVGPDEAKLNFVDLKSGQRWTFRPNRGRVPWWIFDKSRRVAGTSAHDYFSAAGLLNAKPGDVFTDIVPAKGALYERFWEPLVVGALNIAPIEAAAILLKPMLLETFARGADACRPMIVKTGLGLTFIDPALSLLEQVGARIRYGTRVKRLNFYDRKIKGLEVSKEVVEVADSDVVVSAVPQWIASDLLPDYSGPTSAEPIVNVHYRLDEPVDTMDQDPVLGVIGGMAQWIFVRGEIISVTISAAAKESELSGEDIAKRVWNDVAQALDLEHEALPKWRVVKERRATFLQTPQEVRRRPATRTQYQNLYLAGDWTDTRLPATIEGSIRSGELVAVAVRSAA